MPKFLGQRMGGCLDGFHHQAGRISAFLGVVSDPQVKEEIGKPVGRKILVRMIPMTE